MHGNMTSMPQLQAMQWTFKDELQMSRRQAVNAGYAEGILHQGDRTDYVYDGNGQCAGRSASRRRGSGERSGTMWADLRFIASMTVVVASR